MAEEKDIEKKEEQKNDYAQIEKWKSDVKKYLKDNPRIDDAFIETFYSKKVMARFLSKKPTDLEDAMFMNGLDGIDCTNIDFSKLSVENYQKLVFDTETKFPPDIAPIFKAILEKAKNFGFGFEELIQEGKLSGEGINIAVIDQSFNINSIDKNDVNIVRNDADSEGDYYHGKIVTSLLASKSCGVAKGANVFFYEKNTGLGSAFEKIVQYNENCENDSDKITVLSGSWAISKEEFEKWQVSLRDVGCELVCQNNFIENFTEISGGDVLLEMTEEEKEGFVNDKIRNLIDTVDLNKLVKIPINRTYHQFGVEDGFKYQPFYSNSWGIPQVAGLFALYKEKDKTLIFEEFCDMCRESALENGIINPKGIYELIERKQEKMLQDSINAKESKVNEENIRKKYQRDGSDKEDARGVNVQAVDKFIEMLKIHEKSTDLRVRNIAENFEKIDILAPNFTIFQSENCLFMRSCNAYQISGNEDMFGPSHEFGHAVLSIMNKNEVPENYGEIILRAKEHALVPENREFFKEYIQYLCGKTDRANERTEAEKGPVSDIISSIFQRPGLRIGTSDNICFFPSCHERSCYYDEENDKPKLDKILDEDFANFYALKATNNEKEIETIRKLFGDEFVETLEEQLDKADKVMEKLKYGDYGENPVNISDQIKSVVVFAREGEISNISLEEKDNQKKFEGDEK